MYVGEGINTMYKNFCRPVFMKIARQSIKVGLIEKVDGNKNQNIFVLIKVLSKRKKIM